MICGLGYWSFIHDRYPEYEVNLKDGEYRSHINYYAKLDWMKKQSFCWKGQPQVQLLQTFARGLDCYTFNFQPDMLNADE
jgi:hypothetical protein